jgi:hypothetical protein
VAIGQQAGRFTQKPYTVAIGNIAGQSNQQDSAVAIGNSAGQSNQGISAVAIGINAGNTGQNQNAVAIGIESGQSNQGASAVAIGQQAGRFTQKPYTVAIGYYSGQDNQQDSAVAIGQYAGQLNQGSFAIAIGSDAGYNNQGSNTIVLNASGIPLNTQTGVSNALYIAPIRSSATAGGTLAGCLAYDTNTKEISYNTAKTFVLNHPTDENRYLVHSCLEGPENGVFYRGRGDISEGESCGVVKLPQYADKFAYDFTIHITPIYVEDCKYGHRSLSVSDISNGEFRVYGYPGPFHWIVHGTRSYFNAEPLKSEVNVKGSGPYTYIEA